MASGARDSFHQPIWAHSSPIYLQGTDKNAESQAKSAKFFTDRIDEAMEWVSKKGKFYNDAQRREVLDLHRAGQDFYKKLLR